MTWTTFHSRGEILRSVIATANTRRDGLLPFDVDGVADTFKDEIDLLGALQLRWHTRLSGRIEHELHSQPLDLEQAVATAWAETRDEMPGIRAVLDRAVSNPSSDEMAWVAATATAKERAMLAVMSGLAGVNDLQAPVIGARVENRARNLRPTVTTGARTDLARPTFIARLRSALAA